MSYWLATLDDDPFFRSSYRSPALSPALSRLSRLDSRILDIGSLLASLERDVGSLSRQFGLGRSLDTLSSSPNVLSNVETKEDGERKYIVNVPLGSSVRPEDVKVGLKDGIVTIEAKREQKSEDGNSRLYQEYVRKFNLPPGVKMNEVKSELSPEGVLTLEAPLPKEEKPKIEEVKEDQKAIEERKPQPIPISIE